MNELIITPKAQTMSSLEIAKLTGKEHGDVLKDIRRVLAEVEIGEGEFSGTYLDKSNRQSPCFNLPRRECDLIIAGYSAKYRLAIIDRWQELEKKELRVMSPMEMVIASAQAIMRIEQEQAEHAKRLDAIEAKQSEANAGTGFYSVLGYANLKGKKLTTLEAARIGKLATKASEKVGIQMGKVPDARYGSVKTYFEDILNEVFALGLASVA